MTEKMNLADALDITFPVMISAVGGGGKTTFVFELAHLVRRSGRTALVTTTTAMYHPEKAGFQFDYLFTGKLPMILPQPASPDGMLAVGATAHPAKARKLRGYDPAYIDGLNARGLFDAILIEADGARQKPVKAPADHEPVIPVRSDLVVGVIGLDCLLKPMLEKHVHRPALFGTVTGIGPGEPITGQALVRLAASPAGLFKGTPPDARRVVLLNKADSVDLEHMGKLLADSILQEAIAVERVLVARLERDDAVVVVKK